MALGEQLKAAARRATREAAGRARTTQVALATAPRIVAVVGDASIVNGVSFEGLNNLGLVKRQMLIVLNDNSMAIDRDGGVGGEVPLQGPAQPHVRGPSLARPRAFSNTCPASAAASRTTLERIKKSIRMALPPSQLFESLNIPVLRPGGRPRHRVPDPAVQGAGPDRPPGAAARLHEEGQGLQSRRQGPDPVPFDRPLQDQRRQHRRMRRGGPPAGYHGRLRRVADRPGRAG